jgi:hypothetical protein
MDLVTQRHRVQFARATFCTRTVRGKLSSHEFVAKVPRAAFAALMKLPELPWAVSTATGRVGLHDAGNCAGSRSGMGRRTATKTSSKTMADLVRGKISTHVWEHGC